VEAAVLVMMAKRNLTVAMVLGKKWLRHEVSARSDERRAKRLPSSSSMSFELTVAVPVKP
jgi:hypothetical protein